MDPDEDQFAFSPDLTLNCLCSGRQNLPLLSDYVDVQSDLSLYWVGMPSGTFCYDVYLVDGYQVLCSQMLEVIKHPTADTNDP